MDIGRRGDFYTSVSTGELFGQLLASQFANWLEEMRSAGCGMRIVEAGAHDGQLAKNILTWLQSSRPELFDQMEYVIIEPSARRQEWQKKTLKHFESRVRWSNNFESLSRATGHSPHYSIIFSNELLDAFPVHRFGWDANTKHWFEWGVAVDGDKFVWARSADGSSASSVKKHQLAGGPPALQLPSSLLEVLPHNYTIETSPAAEKWWREAAGVLARGKLLAIDYGFTADEMFSPARARGTLRAYFRHHATDGLLANPGGQDLTAHVNFSAIQRAGADAGLKTEYFGSQAKFLTEILTKATKSNSFGQWSAKQTRQFQTLTHPDHLGRAFRVLVQSR